MQLLQAAIWVDQGINVLLGGYADETLSARAHRMREKKHKYWGWAAKAIDALFFWEADHCLQAHQSEVLRRIRAAYSTEDEQYFSRIGVGVALGAYQFQAGEQAALLAFGAHVETVRQWGKTQRAELGL